MFKRILPTIAAALTLTGAITVAGLAGADRAGACPPPSSGPTSTVPPTTVMPDGRCAIDAEAYFRDYHAAENELATTTAMPTGAPAPANAVADMAVEMPPPIVIDEPGVLDDNTFVDAGDSLWVATEDDRGRRSRSTSTPGRTASPATCSTRATGSRRSAIRVEEWVNAFDYDDPAPTDVRPRPGHRDAAMAPSLDDGTQLVRVGVSVREISRRRPAAGVNITLVVDRSGSMDIRERLGLVQSSLALLADRLRSDDTVSVVSFERPGPAAAPADPGQGHGRASSTRSTS